jgi:hypothetical protein
VARALGVVATVAGFGLSAAPAIADESLQATGAITFTWQGDPARGCAAEGLCGIQGALVLGAQGGADATRLGGRTSILLFPAATTIRVRNTQANSAGECVDVPANGGGANLLIAARAGGGLSARVEPPISSGRCAGPLPQDLAGLRLPVSKTAGRRPSFDLRGSQSFGAGPFSGSVVSTLVLRPSSIGGGSTSTSGSSQGPPSGRKVLIEQVTLRYRVATVPGALEVSFGGEPDPFCAALDACGATGTLSLSPAPLDGTLTLTASRIVRRRIGSRQAIADFKAGRLGKPFGIFGGRARTAEVTETYAGGGGLRCQDSSSSQFAESLFVGGPPGGGAGVGDHEVGMTLNEPPDVAVLRTHCPGPTDIDVFGNSMGVVARGSIGLRELLARHSTVSLSNPGGFSAVGYVGSRSGAIGFSLALEHVRAGTLLQERP